MQITKVKQRAHVILATSEYSFLTWLQNSEPPNSVLNSHVHAAAHPLV